MGTAQQAQSDAPVLIGAGGGIFFFWQLGGTQYLNSHYGEPAVTSQSPGIGEPVQSLLSSADLSGAEMIGASAGALVVVLAMCEVGPGCKLSGVGHLPPARGQVLGGLCKQAQWPRHACPGRQLPACEVAQPFTRRRLSRSKGLPSAPRVAVWGMAAKLGKALAKAYIQSRAVGAPKISRCIRLPDLLNPGTCSNPVAQPSGMCLMPGIS